MTLIEFLYFEVQDQDFTGVEITLRDADNEAVKYSNFDRQSMTTQVWGNQREVFSLPSKAAALQFIESAGSYHRVF